jgi:hypothetical protein
MSRGRRNPDRPGARDGAPASEARTDSRAIGRRTALGALAASVASALGIVVGRRVGAPGACPARHAKTRWIGH